jgi:sulfite reductase alpha subunit-like flavoprotein
VLQEFESVKIPWQKVCSLVPSMRGRQFSIASACKEEEGSTKVELLIAIVKYKTVIKRVRQGVCTRYIAGLEPGQRISVTLQPGGLNVTKKETDRPVIMVAPGTGVAPMRSLVYQRVQWRKELGVEGNIKDLLFFGCRTEDADYFFKDEWAKLVEEGVPLEVFAAFSRDQVGLPIPDPSP